MTTESSATRNPRTTMPDASLIAEIAREVINVIQRDSVPASSVSLPKLVTLDSLDSISDSRVTVDHRAVVTPSARDEASRRGIKIVFADSEAASGTSVRAPVADGQLDAFETQIVRRGIAIPSGVRVIWCDSPAEVVFQECRQGIRAVMVTAVSDVPRFADQFAPTTWVLDRQRLSLIAAVNAAAAIARCCQYQVNSTNQPTEQQRRSVDQPTGARQ